MIVYRDPQGRRVQVVEVSPANVLTLELPVFDVEVVDVGEVVVGYFGVRGDPALDFLVRSNGWEPDDECPG